MPDIFPHKRAAAPLLSLAMIVKDGGQLFASLLEEACRWVDEIVVGDTGSRDGSPQVALDHGARLLDVPWQDDFALARNQVLENCRGRWVLVLDADEQLCPGDWEDIATWVKSSTDSGLQVAGSMMTRNYLPGSLCRRGWQANPKPDSHALPSGAPADGFVPSTKVRLFPGRTDIRFAGHLHETVEASLRNAGVPTVPMSWPIHHFGLLADQSDPVRLSAKQKKYLKLARRKAGANPHLPGAWAELADCAIACGHLQQALTAIERALVLLPGNADYRLVAAGVLKDLGQLELAEAQLDAAYLPGSIPEQTRAEIAHLHAQILILQNRNDQARPHLDLALDLAPDSGQYLNTLGAWHLQGGRGRRALVALEKARSRLPGAVDPLLNLALLYTAAGQALQAQKHFRLVLELDPTHAKARQGLDRLEAVPQG